MQPQVNVTGGKGFRLSNVEVTGTGQGGVILEGGDRTSLTPANHTIAEAEAVYARLHGCAGFTFKSNHSQPAGRVKCYFKSVAQSNVDGLWWTYLKPKPAFRFANTHGDPMVLQQAPAKSAVYGIAVGKPSAVKVTVTDVEKGSSYEVDAEFNTTHQVQLQITMRV